MIRHSTKYAVPLLFGRLTSDGMSQHRQLEHKLTTLKKNSDSNPKITFEKAEHAKGLNRLASFRIGKILFVINRTSELRVVVVDNFDGKK